MYYIIGADGREYGPVDADQIRRWLTEGRINSQTNTRADGTTDWKPLGALPEFSTRPQTPPLMSPPPIPSPRPPGADKKIVAGILGILLGAWGIHKFYLGYTTEGILQIVITIFSCGLGGLLGFIEGIIYLTKSDQDFVATYITGKKGWF